MRKLANFLLAACLRGRIAAQRAPRMDRDGEKKEATDTPGSVMSVSVVAGEGLEPPTHGL